MTQRRVAAVVLAYGEEERLAECLSALLAQPLDRLIVVDNGFTSAEPLPEDARITWLYPGVNTGFTGGCNLGAAAASDCEIIVLVNSDLVVAPGAIAALVAALAEPQVGIASGLVVLYDRPDVVNSAGNPVHYSMFTWAGDLGEPLPSDPHPFPVTVGSGALLAVRQPDWAALGGLHELLFAYGEDTELSLRMWLGGQAVVCVPAAVGRHDYVFNGTPGKLYLVERNRLVNVATIFQGSTLLVLAPALVLVEAAVLAAAVAGGWWNQKTRGYQWLWAHRHEIRARRHLIQATRKLDDADLFAHLVDRITPSGETGQSVPGWFNTFLAGYGRFARSRIAARERRISRSPRGSLGVGTAQAASSRVRSGSAQ